MDAYKFFILIHQCLVVLDLIFRSKLKHKIKIRKIKTMEASVHLKQAIEKYGSTRAFRPNLIPDTILAEILHLATMASSGYNS